MLAEERERQALIQGQTIKLKQVPFNDAAQAFIEWAKGEYAAHPNTWKRLRSSLAAASLFWGSRTLSSITAGDIEDYKSHRRAVHGVKPITIRHDLHALSPLWKYCLKHSWCSTSPLRGVSIPSDSDSRRMNILTPQQEKTYFDWALYESARLVADSDSGNTGSMVRASRAFKDLYDIGRLMILQGARPSEVMAAEARDVSIVGATWDIPRSKSSAGRRMLYLTLESVSITAPRVARGGYLFPGKVKGTHLTDVQHAHERVLDLCPGLAFVLYDLRHTFATRMAEGGCDIATLAKILGHANLRTVQRYIHISETHAREAMEQYDRTLRGAWVARF